MYNKVILPLDGSELAEVALPHLEEIARGCAIPEIILVSVTERIKGRAPKAAMLAEGAASESHAPASGVPISTYYGGAVYQADSKTPYVLSDVGRMARSAWNYLSKMSAGLEKKGLKTRAHVLEGHPAEEIIRFAQAERADLIVMASRGKSGFSRWDIGSVADKIIRATDIPVVLVKPKAGFKETRPKRKGN